MVQNDNKNVIRVIIGMAFLLSFLFVINPVSRSAISIYLLFLIVSLVVYSIKSFQKDLIGINLKNIGRVFILAGGLSIAYYIITKYVPGLSLALPLLPNAISDQLKFFIVVFVASTCEEILFRGSLLGYIKSFNPSKRQIVIAIIIQALAFSLFHLTAYITGFYNYPNFASALVAFQANISSFIVALVFGLLAGFLVTRNGIKNLLLSILLHMAFNFIVYSALVIGAFSG